MKGLLLTFLLVTTFLTVFSSTDVAQREGRFFLDILNIVRLNPNSRILVGIQITVPVSVFMPDLGVFGRQSRSHDHTTRNSWPFYPEEAFPTCAPQGLSIKEYLQLLQIDVEPCQELFICQMSSDPSKYMPLSEILLKKLSANKWMKDSRFAHMMNSTEYNLFQAAQIGADANQECRNKYWDCPVDSTSMINMRLLRGLQFLSNTLDIRFVGETDAYLDKN